LTDPCKFRDEVDDLVKQFFLVTIYSNNLKTNNYFKKIKV